MSDFDWLEIKQIINIFLFWATGIILFCCGMFGEGYAFVLIPVGSFIVVAAISLHLRGISNILKIIVKER